MKRIIILMIMCLCGLSIPRASFAQQTYCAPNSLPRSCGGLAVCTIVGNCGLLQSIGCCNTSSGFPTNTPTGLPTSIPTPSNLPTFGAPTATPTPTPSYYGPPLSTWFTQDLSQPKEEIQRVIVDSGGSHVYIVGRYRIGEPEGWTQSSLGFIKKVLISDKSVVWTHTMGSYLGYYAGGLYDVKQDGSGVYVSGFSQWGKNAYYAKLNSSTGAVVWEKNTALDSYWSIDKGVGLDIDNTYVYMLASAHDGTGPDTPTDLGTNAKWVVLKIQKSDGATSVTRSTQLTAGDDIPKSIVLSGAYAIVSGVRNGGTWYVEKLNKSNLTVASSVSSVSGIVGEKASVVDATAFYVAGVVGTGASSQFRVERRKISNLSLDWSYAGGVIGTTQANPHLALKSTTLIMVGNHTVQSGWPQDVRVTYLASSNGSVSRTSVHSGIGSVGSVWYGVAAKTYLSGSTEAGAFGAVYEVDQVEYTPTPTPTIPTFAGCPAVTWTAPVNVTISGNTFTGTTYTEWNFDNGATANFSSDTAIGGYAEIPQANPNYGAMWGIAPQTADTGWVEFAWYAPFYSGSEMYIVLPGRSAIPMGTGSAGDRFAVQKTGSSIIFSKLPYGLPSWQTQYVYENATDTRYEFRGRVAGYSQVHKAYAGAACQLVTIPSPTPFPTLPPNTVIYPWYTTNLSSYPEFGHALYPDVTGEYVYLVGRKNIGRPYGWHQSSDGFIQKIRVSDKQVMWTKNMGYGLGMYHGGLYDVKDDGSALYVTGFTWWGTDMYTGKFNRDTGATIWEKEDNLGWSWLPYKGLDFDTDADYLYIASNSTKNDQDADMVMVKKSKATGQTVATRALDLSNNDWDGYTNVVAVGDYLYLGGYREYDKPNWYVEKVRKSDLGLVTSVVGVSGVVDMHGMVSDGVYLYVSGFQVISGGTMWSSSLKTQARVEKRKLSDLSLVWAYNTAQTDRLQGSTALAFYNNEILMTANDSIDRVGWFGSAWMGNNLRFSRLNKETGQELFSGAYDGVGNVGSIEKDIYGNLFLAGATANTAQTAIFKINDILTAVPPPPFGVHLTQTTIGSVAKGQPIEIQFNITNDSEATQAAWAFNFLSAVPTSIIGVTWTCEVVSEGLPKGDMYAYSTRCGAISSGSGNTVQFSHSSEADPLIHPGGALRVTVRGVVAPNAPSSITSTATISSYVGWTENHFYSMNFITSPGDYLTLPDNNATDNTTTAILAVGNAVPTPTISGGPTRTPTPTPATNPTPTPPASIAARCFDDQAILRVVIDGTEEYYCEDTDTTGHNFIVIRSGVVEKLNGVDTVVSDVRFTPGEVINGYQMMEVSFAVKPRVATGAAVQRARRYATTLRIKL